MAQGVVFRVSVAAPNDHMRARINGLPALFEHGF
jgi:hypothetical protein